MNVNEVYAKYKHIESLIVEPTFRGNSNHPDLIQDLWGAIIESRSQKKEQPANKKLQLDMDTRQSKSEENMRQASKECEAVCKFIAGPKGKLKYCYFCGRKF